MFSRNSHTNRLLIFISVFLCLICGILFTQSSAGPSGNNNGSLAAKDTQVIPETSNNITNTSFSESPTAVPSVTVTPTPVPKKLDVSPNAANGIWTARGSDWLFMIDGTAYTGWLTDTDGKRYYFNKDGIMQRGWLELKGKKYYLDEDGILQTGTFTVDGKKYKTSADGSVKE